MTDHGKSEGELPKAQAPSPPQAAMLNFPMQAQQQTNWDWAAVASSVSAYYAIPNPPSLAHRQCELANWAFSRSDCCLMPLPIGCDKPFSIGEALSHVGVLQQELQSPIALADITAQIAANRPIVVRIQWTGSGEGHAVVIIGYDCTGDAPTITLKDPWGQVLTLMPLSDFPAGYTSGGTWTHTYLTTPPA
jgi:hypothetical protein